MISIKRIPFDSPFFPLPADYFELDVEGQRLARVNGCRQWIFKRGKRHTQTKVEKARAGLAALQFFDQYYLHNDEDADWWPMFYENEARPIAHMHKIMHATWFTDKSSVAVAPRGGAKSVRNWVDMLLRITTHPMYSFIYATSSLKNVQKCSSRLRTQLKYNDRLIDDFGPESDGRIAPVMKSGRSFGTEFFELENGSNITLLSAKSKQRGGRPTCYVLDDPEYDPDAESSMAVLRDYIERLIFKIASLMLTQPGSQLRWIGTFISKRHYLWHAMSMSEGPNPLSEDPRFNYWTRLFFPAEYEDQGKLVSCWPSVWPLTEADRIKLAVDDPYYEEAESLEAQQLRVGSSIYSGEMLGKPGEGEDAFFKELNKSDHGYWFEGDLTNLETDPYDTTCDICWQEYDIKAEKYNDVKVRFSDFLRTATLFITVDTSYTAKATSDFKVSNCMAYYTGNLLFEMDMWAKKAKPEALVDATFKMANKWRAASIHVEAIKEGITVYHDLKSKATTTAKETMGMAYVPRVMKFNPGKSEKTAKIRASMTNRLEYGTFKIPWQLRNKQPWRELCNQISEFNPEVSDGGLKHDDHLDTASMHMFVLKGAIHKATAPVKKVLDPPLVRLKRGELISSDGQTPLAYGLDLSKIPMDQLEEIMEAVGKQVEKKGIFE
jgi:hypothetical protein